LLDATGGIGAAQSASRTRGPLLCEPGVVRLFGAVDIGRQGQVEGWAEPEEGHVWNDGAAASLLLAVPAPPPRLLLMLGGEPYVTRVRPAQEVTLFGNGLRLRHWRLTQRASVPLEVEIEPEWWLRRGRRALMRLDFHMPHCLRPRDAADGPDGRELALCLRTISLTPLPDDATEAA